MIHSQPQAPPPKQPLHWPSLLILINAGLGLVVFLGIAGTTSFNAILSLVNRASEPEVVGVLLSYAVAGLLLGGLLIPAMVLAVRRIGGQNVTSSKLWDRILTLLHPKRWIWFYPLIVLAGYGLNSLQSVSWLFMPVFNVLALGIPIAWLLWLGSKRLAPGSLQRNWSVFSIGITFSPLLIVVIEVVLMIAGLILMAILLSTVFTEIDLNLDLLLSTLSEGADLQEISEQEILEFIQQPAVLAILLVFVSGLVPLIEEIFKPAAVWLMWRRPISPQDGWVLGLISGAGFALIENLGNTTVGEGWSFLVLARAGASALHMFNTAIISYTVVLAREKKRVMPAVLALLGAILIHALWNGVTIFATISSLETGMDDAVWPIGSILILAGISISMIAGIMTVNRYLFSQSSQALAEEAVLKPPDPGAVLPEKIESEQ